MTKVIVNGTFDLLHVGHLNLLKFAKSFPDAYVYVLIDSDRRVKEIKGSNRPVNTQEDRKVMLEALRYVDAVNTFDSDEELTTRIQKFEPDIMVKGDDYRDRPVIGQEYCKEIVFYERDSNSTTNKIQHIVNRRSLRRRL